MSFRRLTSLLKRTALAFIALVVLLVLAEVGARTFTTVTPPLALFPLPPVITAPSLVVYSPGAGYRLAPNLHDVPAFDSTVRTNQRGIRMDRALEVKPRTRVRVACYGDSLTFGAGVSASEAYPAILQEKLRSFFPAHDIDVINMGVPGHTVLRGEAFIAETFAEVQPDVIVAQYFSEDVTASGILDSEVAPTGFVESFVRPWAGRSQLAAHLMAACRPHTARAIFDARLPRVSAEDYLDAVKRIHGYCYRKGVEFLGVGPVYRESGMDALEAERALEYQRYLRDLSGWQEIPVQFTDELNNSAKPEDASLFRNSRQLTAAGHRLLGERLAADLRRRVRTRLNELAENHPAIPQHTENE